MGILNIYNFLKKHKFEIFLPAISLLLFFSGLLTNLYIVAIALAIIFYSLCDFGETICGSMFFGMYSSIHGFYVYSLIGAFVIVFIRFFIDIYKKKVKFFPVPFFITTLIVIVFQAFIIHIVMMDLSRVL